mmetsp:Transcript_1282/g.2494  ORF Transcript_1282/g.2494 Transcript_1282/m.2494 type:complete len:272 (-) Transcript_1282:117-932(-)
MPVKRQLVEIVRVPAIQLLQSLFFLIVFSAALLLLLLRRGCLVFIKLIVIECVSPPVGIAQRIVIVLHCKRNGFVNRQLFLRVAAFIIVFVIDIGKVMCSSKRVIMTRCRCLRGSLFFKVCHFGIHLQMIRERIVSSTDLNHRQRLTLLQCLIAMSAFNRLNGAPIAVIIKRQLHIVIHIRPLLRCSDHVVVGIVLVRALRIAVLFEFEPKIAIFQLQYAQFAIDELQVVRTAVHDLLIVLAFLDELVPIARIVVVKLVDAIPVKTPFIKM